MQSVNIRLFFRISTDMFSRKLRGINSQFTQQQSVIMTIAIATATQTATNTLKGVGQQTAYKSKSNHHYYIRYMFI